MKKSLVYTSTTDSFKNVNLSYYYSLFFPFIKNISMKNDTVVTLSRAHSNIVDYN